MGVRDQLRSGWGGDLPAELGLDRVDEIGQGAAHTGDAIGGEVVCAVVTLSDRLAPGAPTPCRAACRSDSCAAAPFTVTVNIAVTGLFESPANGCQGR